MSWRLIGMEENILNSEYWPMEEVDLKLMFVLYCQPVSNAAQEWAATMFQEIGATQFSDNDQYINFDNK